MLENETKIDACVRICVTNFTFAQDEEEVITTTEQAYIEGATARKGFLSGLFLGPGQVRQQCCRTFEFLQISNLNASVRNQNFPIFDSNRRDSKVRKPESENGFEVHNSVRIRFESPQHCQAGRVFVTGA